MSLYCYRESIKLLDGDHDFEALIMAAMRKADTYNTERLKLMWPEIWEDLQARYNAPGGLLPGDPLHKEDGA